MLVCIGGVVMSYRNRARWCERVWYETSLYRQSIDCTGLSMDCLNLRFMHNICMLKSYGTQLS